MLSVSGGPFGVRPAAVLGPLWLWWACDACDPADGRNSWRAGKPYVLTHQQIGKLEGSWGPNVRRGCRLLVQQISWNASAGNNQLESILFVRSRPKHQSMWCLIAASTCSLFACHPFYSRPPALAAVQIHLGGYGMGGRIGLSSVETGLSVAHPLYYCLHPFGGSLASAHPFC